MNLINYDYKGRKISFISDKNVMVNATQMAKPFGKRPNDYLSLPTTNKLIKAITKKSGISENQIVTTKAGTPQFGGGTWMHEDLALDFAQWLSVDFRLWCNDRIKELMRHGITATPQAIEDILADPDNAIRILTELKQEREALAAAKKQINTLEIQRDTYHSENRRLLKLKDRTDKIMQKQAPLVEYAQNVLDSNDTFTTTQIAKELDMSAQALNKFLHEAGVMFKQGGQWFLYSKYMSKGYVKTREYTYPKKDGRTGIMLSTAWTEAGRMFIRQLVLFKHSLTKEAE